MLALFCSWLFWIIGAALLGFLLAWLLRGGKAGEWKTKWEEENASYKSLKSNHDGYLTKYEKLNSKHNKLIASNNKLSKDLSSYESKVVNLEKKLSFADSGAATVKETVTVADNSYEIRSLESKIDRLERDIAGKEEDIERLNEENENYATKLEVLELTTEEAKKEKEKAVANIKKYEEYRPRFEQANLERNTLKYKYEQLLAAKGSVAQVSDQSDGDQSALEAEISKLKASVDQSDNQTKALQFKIQELEENNTKTAKEYEEIKTKYTSLLNLQERTEAKLKEASGETPASEEVSPVKAELTSLKVKNEAQAKEIAQLKQNLEQQKSQAAANDSADELAALKNKNGAQADEIAKLKQDLEQQKSQAAANDKADELAALKNKNGAQADEIAKLKQQLVDQKAKAATVTFVPTPVAAPKEKAKPATKEEKEAKASAAKAQLSGAIGTKIKKASAADKDDLQRISGVGPFIEKKLNDLGIYTFEQISQFDGELVQIVTDAIAFFPGRIQRDDWVGQATTFMKES